jgi:hypothetical protein
MINLDGEVIEISEKEVYKTPTINPFDFVNAIHYTKEQLIVDDWSEKQYNSFIVNKTLSFNADTVIQANEMNSRPHLDKKLQYDFLINSVRPRKRYAKWIKAEMAENIEVIKRYYKYNTEKAYQVVNLLSEQQINTIKEKMFTGGLKNGTRID